MLRKCSPEPVLTIYTETKNFLFKNQVVPLVFLDLERFKNDVHLTVELMHLFSSL